jgi:hypothetical protein
LDTASHDLAFDGADADDLPRQLLSLVRGGKGHPGHPAAAPRRTKRKCCGRRSPPYYALPLARCSVARCAGFDGVRNWHSSAVAAWAAAARMKQLGTIQERRRCLMLFSAARCGPFCDRNTTLDDFLDDRFLLLHNCPNLSSQNRSGHRSRCRYLNRWEVKFLSWLRI